MRNKHDGTETSEHLQDMRDADKFATQMDDVLLDMAEMDADLCPPDKRYAMPGREAWVYEHGNICELVFVRTD